MSRYCTSIYFAFLLLVFPLYFQNNYIDILESKTKIFVIGTLLYFIAVMICFWLDSIKEYETNKGKNQKRKKKEQQSNFLIQEKKVTAQNIFFICFVAVVILSTLISGNIETAWHAPNTKLFGGRILLYCCGIYYFASKGFASGKLLKMSLILGPGIVCVLTILNRFHVDPLNMYRNLIAEQHTLYLSTIGNANILSNYLCIFVPLFMGLYMVTKDIYGKFLLAFLIVGGIMAGLSTNSDSFFLGTGASLIVYLWFAFTSEEKLQHYFEIGVLSSIAMLILRILEGTIGEEVIWERVQEFLVFEIPWIPLIIFLCVLWIIVERKKDIINYKKIRNVLFVILGISVLVFLMYLVYVNISGSTNANAYFIFNDKWGTNRGFAWSNTIELFRELPWYQKLFGIGQGQFHEFFAVPNELRKKPFVDPHSDYLFYLVSTGYLGFVVWLGLMITAVLYCLRQKGEREVILAAVFVAWLGQATVNTSLVFTAPYLFGLLGICRWYQIEKKYEK